MHRSIVRTTLLAAACASSLLIAGTDSRAASAGSAEPDARHARIVEHWTAARRAAAIPRDLVQDERGQGYIRTASGLLEPYGRRIAGSGGAKQPNAKPGTGDTTPPSISGMDPASAATISTTSYTFKATVTDASGLRSVSFRVQKSGGLAQSFSASLSANNVWTVTLSGLTDGSWTWQVIAKDKANNTRTSDVIGFQVSIGGGGGGGGNVVTNAPWTQGGDVQTAAGRLYFEMPSNARRTRWTGYVCSGTVVGDGGVSGRSVILTASHCVYDDSNKAFARNVLFIPDQDGTTGAGTDLNCSNDPYGCWTPAYGVVDVNWTTRTFPDNVHWDYAFYVVSDSNAHSGTGNFSALDAAVATLPISFAQPAYDLAGSSADYTYALGYSYSEDPNFMYCAEDMSVESADDWWLGSCGLSGGSSGGPWVQSMSSSGSGDIVSVNSWGYTNQPGMAGPKLWQTSASCVFSTATSDTFMAPAADGDEGIAVTCP